MASIELRDVVKQFGEVTVVDRLNLHVNDGEFVVLVGASGCGKSTTLRMIAGLETPTQGKILIDGTDVTDMPPAQRDIAMVFQSYALYPHMDVAQNMSFSLRLSGVAKDQIDYRVQEAAKVLGIEQLLHRKPKELSGGQRQRVAMGRAMVRRPPIFLFDEPLSNLDAALRAQLRVELHDLHAKLGSTMIYVTHDQVEAMTLADRIFVLNQGRIEQTAPPAEIYNRPATRFVARFLGTPEMNLLPKSTTVLLSATALAPEQAIEVGVRPEDLTVSIDGEPNATVEITEPLGWETLCHLRLGTVRLVARLVGGVVPARAQPVRVSVPRERLHFFDAAGRRL